MDCLTELTIEELESYIRTSPSTSTSLSPLSRRAVAQRLASPTLLSAPLGRSGAKDSGSSAVLPGLELGSDRSLSLWGGVRPSYHGAPLSAYGRKKEEGPASFSLSSPGGVGACGQPSSITPTMEWDGSASKPGSTPLRNSSVDPISIGVSPRRDLQKGESGARNPDLIPPLVPLSDEEVEGRERVRYSGLVQESWTEQRLRMDLWRRRWLQHGGSYKHMSVLPSSGQMPKIGLLFTLFFIHPDVLCGVMEGDETLHQVSLEPSHRYSEHSVSDGQSILEEEMNEWKKKPAGFISSRPGLLSPSICMWKSLAAVPGSEGTTLRHLSNSLAEKYKTIYDDLPSIQLNNEPEKNILMEAKEARSRLTTKNHMLVHHVSRGTSKLSSQSKSCLPTIEYGGMPEKTLQASKLVKEVGFPVTFIADCENAGVLLDAFLDALHTKNRSTGAGHDGERTYSGTVRRESKSKEADRQLNGGDGRYCGSQPIDSQISNELFFIGASGRDGRLSHHPRLMTDLMTSCITSPVMTALVWFMIEHEDLTDLHPILLHVFPGAVEDRKTPLGELQFYFMSVVEVIAWSSFSSSLFQRLFHQTKLLRSLYHGYLLAERIIVGGLSGSVSVYPPLPATYAHPYWAHFDYALESCCVVLRKLVRPAPPVKLLPLEFREWLDLSVAERKYTEAVKRRASHHVVDVEAYIRGDGERGFICEMGDTKGGSLTTIKADGSYLKFPCFMDEELQTVEALIKSLTTHGLEVPSSKTVHRHSLPYQHREVHQGGKKAKRQGKRGTRLQHSYSGQMPRKNYPLHSRTYSAFSSTSSEEYDSTDSEALEYPHRGKKAVVIRKEKLGKGRSRAFCHHTVGSVVEVEGPSPSVQKLWLQGFSRREQMWFLRRRALLLTYHGAGVRAGEASRGREGRAGSPSFEMTLDFFIMQLPILQRCMLVEPHRKRAVKLIAQLVDVDPAVVLQCASTGISQIVIKLWSHEKFERMLSSLLFLTCKFCYANPEFILKSHRHVIIGKCFQLLEESFDMSSISVKAMEDRTQSNANARGRKKVSLMHHSCSTSGEMSRERYSDVLCTSEAREGQRFLAASLLTFLYLEGHVPSEEGAFYQACRQLWLVAEGGTRATEVKPKVVSKAEKCSPCFTYTSQLPQVLSTSSSYSETDGKRASGASAINELHHLQLMSLLALVMSLLNGWRLERPLVNFDLCQQVEEEYSPSALSCCSHPLSAENSTIEDRVEKRGLEMGFAYFIRAMEALEKREAPVVRGASLRCLSLLLSQTLAQPPVKYVAAEVLLRNIYRSTGFAHYPCVDMVMSLQVESIRAAGHLVVYLLNDEVPERLIGLDLSQISKFIIKWIGKFNCLAENDQCPQPTLPAGDYLTRHDEYCSARRSEYVRCQMEERSNPIGGATSMPYCDEWRGDERRNPRQAGVFDTPVPLLESPMATGGNRTIATLTAAVVAECSEAESSTMGSSFFRKHGSPSQNFFPHGELNGSAGNGLNIHPVYNVLAVVSNLVRLLLSQAHSSNQGVAIEAQGVLFKQLAFLSIWKEIAENASLLSLLPWPAYTGGSEGRRHSLQGEMNEGIRTSANGGLGKWGDDAQWSSTERVPSLLGAGDSSMNSSFSFTSLSESYPQLVHLWWSYHKRERNGRKEGKIEAGYAAGMGRLADGTLDPRKIRSEGTSETEREDLRRDSATSGSEMPTETNGVRNRNDQREVEDDTIPAFVFGVLWRIGSPLLPVLENTPFDPQEVYYPLKRQLQLQHRMAIRRFLVQGSLFPLSQPHGHNFSSYFPLKYIQGGMGRASPLLNPIAFDAEKATLDSSTEVDAPHYSLSDPTGAEGWHIESDDETEGRSAEHRPPEVASVLEPPKVLPVSEQVIQKTCENFHTARLTHSAIPSEASLPSALAGSILSPNGGEEGQENPFWGRSTAATLAPPTWKPYERVASLHSSESSRVQSSTSFSFGLPYSSPCKHRVLDSEEEDRASVEGSLEDRSEMEKLQPNLTVVQDASLTDVRRDYSEDAFMAPILFHPTRPFVVAAGSNGNVYVWKYQEKPPVLNRPRAFQLVRQGYFAVPTFHLKGMGDWEDRFCFSQNTIASFSSINRETLSGLHFIDSSYQPLLCTVSASGTVCCIREFSSSKERRVVELFDTVAFAKRERRYFESGTDPSIISSSPSPPTCHSDYCPLQLQLFLTTPQRGVTVWDLRSQKLSSMMSLWTDFEVDSSAMGPANNKLRLLHVHPSVCGMLGLGTDMEIRCTDTRMNGQPTLQFHTPPSLWEAFQTPFFHCSFPTTTMLNGPPGSLRSMFPPFRRPAPILRSLQFSRRCDHLVIGGYGTSGCEGSETPSSAVVMWDDRRADTPLQILPTAPSTSGCIEAVEVHPLRASSLLTVSASSHCLYWTVSPPVWVTEGRESRGFHASGACARHSGEAALPVHYSETRIDGEQEPHSRRVAGRESTRPGVVKELNDEGGDLPRKMESSTRIRAIAFHPFDELLAVSTTTMHQRKKEMIESIDHHHQEEGLLLFGAAPPKTV